jgi:hypothetical protein
MAYVDEHTQALKSKDLWYQVRVATRIHDENWIVKSTVNGIKTSILRKKLQCSNPAYFNVTHNEWEYFVGNVIEELATYGYVMVTIKKKRYKTHENESVSYYIPNVISATRYVLVPIPDEPNEFSTLFAHSVDSKKKCRLFTKNPPHWNGQLRSDVYSCRYLHELASNLLQAEEHATMLNSRSRGIVITSHVQGPPTQYDLLGEADDDMRELDPQGYHTDRLNMQAEIDAYKYHQQQAAMSERNIATSILRPGFASTSQLARPAEHAQTTELDFSLTANSTLQAAPAAIHNSRLIDMLNLINKNIEAIFGHTVNDENKSGQAISAEAMSINERRTERGIEAIRFKVDQILEFISAYILFETDDNAVGKNGVWLSTPMSEHVFDKVQMFLTPEARRRYTAQVYNVDLEDIVLQPTLEATLEPS